MKKILLIITIIFSFFSVSFISIVNAGAPEINCFGLPGCPDSITDIAKPEKEGDNVNNGSGISIIGKITSELIKYVAVIAVITIMIGGVMYLISGGDEEKVKKAKSWIIWSLVGVLVSISAYGLVNMLNNISIS